VFIGITSAGYRVWIGLLLHNNARASVVSPAREGLAHTGSELDRAEQQRKDFTYVRALHIRTVDVYLSAWMVQ